MQSLPNLQGLAQGVQAGATLATGFAGFAAGNANAGIARANAQMALADGAAQAVDAKSRYRAAMGEQLAAQGASGFAMGTGSMLDALQESRVNQAYAMMQISRGAQARAAGYQAQASAAKQSGIMSLIGGALKATSGLINQKIDYANANAKWGVNPSAAAGALQPAAEPVYTDFSGMNWSN